MRALVPLLLGAFVYALGARYSGHAAGAFLGVLALIAGFTVGKIVRGRAVRTAPAPPGRREGEAPLLHGPLRLRQPEGADREAWAYLSDQRLNLLPLEGGEGVELELKALEEIRPVKRGWRGGELSLVFAGKTWRLRVPDAKRWEMAIRDAARK